VRGVNLNIRGTKLHKSMQILAYVDDVVIVRYEKAFNRLEMEVQKMGLLINYNKTKYMESDKLIITTLHKKYTTELIWQINAIADSEIYWYQSCSRKIQNVKYIKH
jgi:hypothetical protein